jgi:phospholipase C
MRAYLATILLACASEPSATPPPDASTPIDTAVVDATPEAPPAPPIDPREAARASCTFRAGALATDTLGNLPAKLPIEHVIVLMQENRSFDHVLGKHPRVATGEMDGFPATYVNTAVGGATYPPVHATTGCLAPDPPHGWIAMHNAYADGKNDGFYREATAVGPGANAISYYDPADLPFYAWLYGEWASSDRYFSSLLGQTAPNRSFLWRATSDGNQTATGTSASVYESFMARGATGRVYLGSSFTGGGAPTRPLDQLMTDLATGDLPTFTVINAEYETSEHPPADIRAGERFVRSVVEAVMKSPKWAKTALIVTYDESGGFFDHVPPPAACPPDDTAANAAFDRLGFRVPFVVVSPFARRGYVSHRVHSHTSITRLVEALIGAPALTNRDANSDALLDLFDFESPGAPPVTDMPAASTQSCTP